MTHSQFTDIPRLSNVGVSPDLPPIISMKEAQEQIARASLAFIAVNTFGEPGKQVKNLLISMVEDTKTLLGGYQKAYQTPVTSFCSNAAKTIGGPLAAGLEIVPTEHIKFIKFASSKPDFDQVQLRIHGIKLRRVEFPPNREDRPLEEMIACKAISADALAQFFNTPNQGAGCKEVMQDILNQASKLLTADQSARYQSQGRPLVVGDSLEKNGGFSWLPTAIEFEESDDKVVVKAVEMKVPMSSPVCKIHSVFPIFPIMV